jgi:hypothetical protein
MLAHYEQVVLIKIRQSPGAFARASFAFSGDKFQGGEQLAAPCIYINVSRSHFASHSGNFPWKYFAPERHRTRAYVSKAGGRELMETRISIWATMREMQAGRALTA